MYSVKKERVCDSAEDSTSFGWELAFECGTNCLKNIHAVSQSSCWFDKILPATSTDQTGKSKEEENSTKKMPGAETGMYPLQPHVDI